MSLFINIGDNTYNVRKIIDVKKGKGTMPVLEIKTRRATCYETLETNEERDKIFNVLMEQFKILGITIPRE